MFFIYWWKWPNLGLTLRFLALVRNCGLFLGLKEGIAQRKTQCWRDIQTTIYFNWSDWVFESIRLGSDNDKAGGKHCTIWAVTACDFTSESELSYSQAKSNGVYPSPAIHIGLIVFILSWKSDLRVTNSHHLDMPLLFCLTKSAFYSDFVCYLLLIFMWTVWDKKKKKKKRKKNLLHIIQCIFSDFGFLTGIHLQIPSNRSLMMPRDVCGGTLWKLLSFVSMNQ